MFNIGGNVYLEPKNRHLLVLPIEQEEKEVAKIVLPDEYRKNKAPYLTCDVLGVADDAEIQVRVGDRVVVERSMLLEINAGAETNYLVLENYVYGRLQDE